MPITAVVEGKNGAPTNKMLPFIDGPEFGQQLKIWRGSVRWDLENWAGSVDDPWSAPALVAHPMKVIWEAYYPDNELDYTNRDSSSPWGVVQIKVSLSLLDGMSWVLTVYLLGRPCDSRMAQQGG